METMNQKPPVVELRVAVTAENYDCLAKFYLDGLGLKPS